MVRMTSKKVLSMHSKKLQNDAAAENHTPVKTKKSINKRITKVESIQHSFPE